MGTAVPQWAYLDVEVSSIPLITGPNTTGLDTDSLQATGEFDVTQAELTGGMRQLSCPTSQMDLLITDDRST